MDFLNMKRTGRGRHGHGCGVYKSSFVAWANFHVFRRDVNTIRLADNETVNAGTAEV